MTLPTSARIIVVGGGIVGCSTAYHLGAMGEDEVLLLERHKLSSGSTWHAAGLVGQLRTNANVTQLLGYSVALGALAAMRDDPAFKFVLDQTCYIEPFLKAYPAEWSFVERMIRERQ